MLAVSAVVALIPLTTGCGQKGGAGVACTAIGCFSVVEADLRSVALGGSTGRFDARICLDGSCKRASGTIDPAKDLSEFGHDGVTVLAGNGGGVTITLDLGQRQFDETTTHDVVVEATLEGNDPVTVRRAVTFRKNEPNGPGCGAPCWVAELDAG